ncbi:MAG TPA: DUF748 domain-containing protein, partial [Steroidobacteraceae bacterium]|nr:DUF748 domain-containing protein [Steroidobacteraceae bacterium]
MLSKWQKRLLISLGVLAALVGAYAVFGYHYAPLLLRKHAVAWVRDAYGRELTLGEIRIDPFRLKLQIRDLRLPDADGQTLVGAAGFLVDFELASVWRRALVFRAIELDQPVVRALVRADGQINLVDLAHPRNAEPQPEKSSGLPRLWVQLLQVTGGNVEYLVASRQQPLVKRIAPIDFSLRDFRTTSEGGQFVLTARSTADEQFDWRGRFALAPQVVSEGEIRIGGLQVATLLDLLPDPPPVVVGSGQIDLSTRYKVSLGEEIALNLQVPTLAVTGLSVGKAGGDADWIGVATLALDDIDFDLAAQRVHAAKLRVEGLKARSWMDADGRVNLQELLPTDHSGAQTARSPVPASSTADNKWSAGVDAVQVIAADLDFEDRRVAERPHFRLQPLEL